MLGFPVLCSHVRADCFCPAMQCLDPRKFVAQWVVGHEVKVAVCVGGFSVYSCRNGAIWVPLDQAHQAGHYQQWVSQRGAAASLSPAPTRPADDHSRGPVITLPYVRGLSEAVRSVLTPLGLRVSFRPNTTLKQLLVRPKDQTPTEELAGVVYQVPCASCPASYVGQTGRCLGKRMKEHRKAVESGDCANSALAEHVWSHHHNPPGSQPYMRESLL